MSISLGSDGDFVLTSFVYIYWTILNLTVFDHKKTLNNR